MSHDANKEIQEASLVGRILSMEALLLLMGIASLVYGIAKGVTISIFWGIIIVPGVFILHKVRRKDWAKHWQEMDEGQKADEERRKNSTPSAPEDK